MEKSILNVFKRPFMAITIVSSNMVSANFEVNRFLFYPLFILPLLPIYKYASSFEDDTVLVIFGFYLIFYTILSIVLIGIIQQVSTRRWSDKEFRALKADQITFPLILIQLINSFSHFIIFYSLLKIITL
ncbi:MAG TPA: hypothetical protein VKY37_07255 [Brumimicrobium sp.]|nr:hypothetical protein [Brumimicrobium sp.]